MKIETTEGSDGLSALRVKLKNLQMYLRAQESRAKGWSPRTVNRLRKQIEKLEDEIDLRDGKWIYEDELQTDITPEYFARSRVIDGVRMYPPHRQPNA